MSIVRSSDVDIKGVSTSRQYFSVVNLDSRNYTENISLGPFVIYFVILYSINVFYHSGYLEGIFPFIVKET